MAWWDRFINPNGQSSGAAGNSFPKVAAADVAVTASEEPFDEVTLPPGVASEENNERSPEATPPAVIAERETAEGTTEMQGNTQPTLTAVQLAVLNAATLAGIDTPEKLSEMQAAAKANAINEPIATEYRNAVRTDLEAQAVRLYGQEKGKRFAESNAHLSVADQKSVAAGWQEQADDKFGIGKNGEEANRTTTPAAMAQAITAEGGAGAPGTDSSAGSENSDKLWGKLSAAEQAHGKAMGYDKSEDAREKYAKNVLDLKGDS